MQYPRNLIIFQIKPQQLDLHELEASFAEHQLREPGPQELEHIGFVSPVSEGSDILVRIVGDCAALAVGARKKDVPASVLNQRLQTKCRELASEGRPVGRKERKRIKDDILADMLRQAFVKQSNTYAWIDNKHGWVLMDASSRKSAEVVISTIRKALGSFPAVPIQPGGEVSTTGTFLEWLHAETAAEGFTLGDECVLAAGDGESTWTGKKVELCSDEVKEHLSAGGVPRKVGLSFGDRVTFVLDDDLSIRKFRLTDVAMESIEDTGSRGDEDPLSYFDASFALVSGEVSQLLDRVRAIFDVQVIE